MHQTRPFKNWKKPQIPHGIGNFLTVATMSKFRTSKVTERNTKADKYELSEEYTWTSWGPASFKKVALVWAAHARAIRVFPVPGGPYKRTPLGGRIPNF